MDRRGRPADAAISAWVGFALALYGIAYLTVSEFASQWQVRLEAAPFVWAAGIGLTMLGFLMSARSARRRSIAR